MKVLLRSFLAAAVLPFFLSATTSDAEPAAAQPVTAPAPSATMETRLFAQPENFPPDFQLDPIQPEPGDHQRQDAAARRALEAQGIKFPPGSAVRIANYQLIVRNTPDQLALIQTLMDRLNDPMIREVLLRTEIISVTPAQYAALLASGADGKALYVWCADALDKPGTGVALEQFSLLRVRSGQRSKTEEINEYPYPTEYDPPQIAAEPLPAQSDPQKYVKEAITPAPARPGSGVIYPPVYPAGAATGFPGTPPTPQSFETKNLGFSMEAEVNIGEDGRLVDMNIAPEFIRIARIIPWHINRDVYQPVFQVRKLSCQILCEMGKTKFAGAMSTPVSVGVAGADKEDRLWLLFITPTFPE